MIFTVFFSGLKTTKAFWFERFC